MIIQLATTKLKKDALRIVVLELKILESGSIKEGVLGCVGFATGKASINSYSEACLDMLAELLA